MSVRTTRDREILGCFDDDLWHTYHEVRSNAVLVQHRAPSVGELQSLRQRGLVGYRPGWVSDSRHGTWALTETGLAIVEQERS